MSCMYRQRSGFAMTSNTFLPNTSSSSSSSQLTVEFDFLFTSEKIAIRRVRHPPAESITRVPPHPDRRASASAAVVVGGEPAPSLVKAVVGAIGNCTLFEPDLRGLIDLAWGEVSRRAEHGGVLRLGFEIRTMHLHLLVVSRAPAAVFLEEVEVREGEEEEKGCCCICLEELIGGGASRMPCSHVFHGGCIREWLWKSRCCPLCRYQLPTATMPVEGEGERDSSPQEQPI